MFVHLGLLNLMASVHELREELLGLAAEHGPDAWTVVTDPDCPYWENLVDRRKVNHLWADAYRFDHAAPYPPQQGTFGELLRWLEQIVELAAQAEQREAERREADVESEAVPPALPAP